MNTWLVQLYCFFCIWGDSVVFNGTDCCALCVLFVVVVVILFVVVVVVVVVVTILKSLLLWSDSRGSAFFHVPIFLVLRPLYLSP
jgi:hypothetical protein